MSAKLTGAPCPRSNCDGTLQCANSKPSSDGRFMERFYACKKCGCRPADNKRRIPIEYSLRRVAG